MEVLQIVAPLIGVLLGSVLSGIGFHFKARQERSRIIALALADLLEIRHRMVGVELILGRLFSLKLLNIEEGPLFRNIFESLLPDDPALSARYDNAVSLLAGIDPVLAFTLRSRDGIPKTLSTLRKLAAEQQFDLGDFKKLEGSLKAAAHQISTRLCCNSLENIPSRRFIRLKNIFGGQ